MTPVEEVMRALDDLVRSGKVLYVGISDTPAWVIAKANMLAELRGWSRFVALQLPYSLADRAPERDLLPMAHAEDLAVAAWGVLEGGTLTGKYRDKAAITRYKDASEGICGGAMRWSRWRRRSAARQRRWRSTGCASGQVAVRRSSRSWARAARRSSATTSARSTSA